MPSTATSPPAAPRPTLAWICASPLRFLAFGLGSGLLRPAPGTWGTLLAWAGWQGVGLLPDVWIAVVLVAGFLLGVWACQASGKALGAPDHSGMVWDEIIAFWLVLWLTPDTLLAQAVAFALFRLFDILKPAPIRFFDRYWKHGFGVMWDDLIAAGYSLLVIAVMVKAEVL